MNLRDILRQLLTGQRPDDVPPPEEPPPPAREPAPSGDGLSVAELAKRVGLSPQELKSTSVTYKTFSIAKRSGGTRPIAAPDDALKKLQKKILRGVLAKLDVHGQALGFEEGYSIVSNANQHAGKAVVLKMDLVDFFGSTKAKRVRDYFKKIGWSDEAAALLEKLTTWQGALPQGAPTSPRLSNLVNYRLDDRLDSIAAKYDGIYTRYADDLVFSFEKDEPSRIRGLISFVKHVLEQEGYRINHHKKLRIRRRHERQLVTGLVVNDRVGLPRLKRRWLRAVRHRLKKTGSATLTAAQLKGWESLEKMIETQGKK